ncbi:hypothetical protein P8C59_005271 [Phyllachora maydis]|uniref:Uncharacterized protein n=1 Tax=Phyllachora maydis TaxID=1825666 RepID=A0AAD9MC33_9PEZI|nr:hypothetical protein P8C59_005271 [Phyllachora maydis]
MSYLLISWRNIGIPTTSLAPAPILAKPAKIILAIRRIAARKAKQCKLAKAYAAAGRAAAAKRRKNRNTTNSGLMANKDNNNAYNRAYIPPTNIKEEEGSSGDNNGVNSSTSNSANKGKGSSAYERSKGTLRYKDIPPHKR